MTVSGTGRLSEKATTETVAEPQPIPWMGILSVLVGLSISIFYGQFLGSGLPDLRGAEHLSVDQGAWLGAVFNSAQMFMGSLTVYLGGLLGPRKVLLVASAVVAVTSTLLPLVSSFALLVTLLAVVGLAAGTFYPLTLTYILRAAPPRLILFGISCYTIDAVGGMHLATALESWYFTHLSWHWFFWHFSVVASLMAVLVFWGMPGAPPKQDKPGEELGERKLKTSWRGFLYLSCGLTAVYLALTQGERLNWFHSGLIVGLFASGGFLLLAAVVRHFVQPNPTVDLSILRRRNILIMSAGLFLFRFVMLGSSSVVPNFLGKVQGDRPEQTGPVLSIVAIPMVVIGVVTALSIRYLQPRVVFATGFAIVAAATLWDNRLSSVWAWNNLLRTEALMGAGLAVTIMGLVGCIILAVINGGAMSSPLRALTVAAWMHGVRLMGGEIGSVSLSRLMDVREKFHSNMLGQAVSLGNPLASQQLLATSKALASQSAVAAVAISRAGDLTGKRISTQAYTLASADAFFAIGVALVCGLLLIAFYRPEKVGFQQVMDTSSKEAA